MRSLEPISLIFSTGAVKVAPTVPPTKTPQIHQTTDDDDFVHEIIGGGIVLGTTLTTLFSFSGNAIKKGESRFCGHRLAGPPMSSNVRGVFFLVCFFCCFSVLLTGIHLPMIRNMGHTLLT